MKKCDQTCKYPKYLNIQRNKGQNGNLKYSSFSHLGSCGGLLGTRCLKRQIRLEGCGTRPFCWLQAGSMEPEGAHSSAENCICLGWILPRQEVCFCVQSRAHHSTSWQITQQNRSNLEKDNSRSQRQWHGSCQIPKQPSCYWTHNLCDVAPFKYLNLLKSK